MFKYTLDNKRYHTLNYHYKKLFNSKVFKISLNGNFSCPNFKNGTGCIYCSAAGAGEFAGNKLKHLEEQFVDIKNIMQKKWSEGKYIAYFQANTNTYAPLEVLKEKFEQVLTFDNVIGLSISTRPDAISSEVMDYLEDLNKRTYLTVELGLQSANNKTLELIKRGHDLECFIKCVEELKKRNIRVIVHIINGLPYETKTDMLNTVGILNNLKIDGLKIHMLYITKGTEIEKIYRKEKFHILTKEEYIDIVCDQLEILDERIVIHRITGDPIPEDLIEPKWLLKKFVVLNDIDKEMKRRNTFQGMKKSS